MDPTPALPALSTPSAAPTGCHSAHLARRTKRNGSCASFSGGRRGHHSPSCRTGAYASAAAHLRRRDRNDRRRDRELRRGSRRRDHTRRPARWVPCGLPTGGECVRHHPGFARPDQPDWSAARAQPTSNRLRRDPAWRASGGDAKRRCQVSACRPARATASSGVVSGAQTWTLPVAGESVIPRGRRQVSAGGAVRGWRYGRPRAAVRARRPRECARPRRPLGLGRGRRAFAPRSPARARRRPRAACGAALGVADHRSHVAWTSRARVASRSAGWRAGSRSAFVAWCSCSSSWTAARASTWVGSRPVRSRTSWRIRPAA